MILLLLVVAASGLRTAFGDCHNGELISSGLDCKQKEYLIELHNKYRELVASGGVDGQSEAANMIELRYDINLEPQAQKLADTCIFEHDTHEHGLGQNLAHVAYHNDKVADMSVLVDMWYNEVVEHGYTGEYKDETGHYSQLIWAKSTTVGCGLAYYKDKEDWYNTYLVCNYSPAGNTKGELPYIKGIPACQDHGLQKSKTHSSLCAVDNNDVKLC